MSLSFSQIELLAFLLEGLLPELLLLLPGSLSAGSEVLEPAELAESEELLSFFRRLLFFFLLFLSGLLCFGASCAPAVVAAPLPVCVSAPGKPKTKLKNYSIIICFMSRFPCSSLCVTMRIKIQKKCC